MAAMTKRWNFDIYIAKEIADQADWMIHHGHTIPEGMTQQQWHQILTRVRDDFRRYSSKTHSSRPEDALALFAQHFDKWWD